MRELATRTMRISMPARARHVGPCFRGLTKERTHAAVAQIFFVVAKQEIADGLRRPVDPPQHARAIEQQAKAGEGRANQYEFSEPQHVPSPMEQDNATSLPDNVRRSELKCTIRLICSWREAQSDRR